MDELRTVQDIFSIAEKLPSDDWAGGWFYRGQANLSWPLKPKAYREPYAGDFDFKYKLWTKNAIRFPELKFTNEFECMAIAQHHGFPTKYLDWSSNILVSTFFACCDSFDTDARLTAYFPMWYVLEPEEKTFQDYDGVVAYQPPPISERIKSQLGNFTYHPTEESVIKSEIFPPTKMNTLFEWVIPAKCKFSILKSLDRLGVNYKTIYPDIDGLSRHFCLMDEANAAG